MKTTQESPTFSVTSDVFLIWETSRCLEGLWPPALMRLFFLRRHYKMAISYGYLCYVLKSNTKTVSHSKNIQLVSAFLKVGKLKSIYKWKPIGFKQQAIIASFSKLAARDFRHIKAIKFAWSPNVSISLMSFGTQGTEKRLQDRVKEDNIQKPSTPLCSCEEISNLRINFATFRDNIWQWRANKG